MCNKLKTQTRPDDFDLLVVLDCHICKKYESLCNESIFKSDEDNKIFLSRKLLLFDLVIYYSVSGKMAIIS